ncbi:heavy metal-associated isoprenylated plant protein 43-like [Hibiscus syriacus]|uniref:heavy metal-associated isoprenylated plant protein 43-like n=1 Tax=Hibiscus syriacus TaxID=106335 RepID=UPI001920D89F|nr:heavy metal-associated isoprenylated plant protein 43-like [Hibiscus syriacus]
MTSLSFVGPMVKKTVLKVDISCHKSRKKLLKAISGLQDKIEVDGGKRTTSVTGDADPYEIIVRTSKVGKHVDLHEGGLRVLHVRPPPQPPKEPQKKPEEKKAEPKKDDKKTDPLIMPHFHNPLTCPVCHRMHVVYTEPTQDALSCNNKP